VDTAPETAPLAAAPKPLPVAALLTATEDSAEPSTKPAPAAGGKQPEDGPGSWHKASDPSAPISESIPASQAAANPMIQTTNQPAASTASTEHAAPSEPSAPAAPTQPEPAAAPTHTAAAHDIKIQVGGEGEPKVEVRVTDRGGDVVVAVRTPDSRLAGDLRQDLPSLATRLEQSGYHATTWQPAADSERQRLADPQAGASGQDAQSQSRQDGREQQRDPQQQKQEEPDSPANPSQGKEQGKDFAWLLSSIR